MSDKTTYLRLNNREARSLIEWFLFQESGDIKSWDRRKSTITRDEVEFLDRLEACITKMEEEPEKYTAMRLAPHYCKIAYRWFKNLPENLIEDDDANMHANLSMFLNELDMTDDL